jgi:SpoVK/Ycf46/Vps4 family AAA+-type ATPase
VDLPSSEERKEILEIHLKRRGRNPNRLDLNVLTEATEGFSGAEIEQVIVSALYTAFSNGATLRTDVLLKEAEKTTPLSRTRSEYVASLRKWAEGRTVSAQ